jgi:hypothetical protein
MVQRQTFLPRSRRTFSAFFRSALLVGLDAAHQLQGRDL